MHWKVKSSGEKWAEAHCPLGLLSAGMGGYVTAGSKKTHDTGMEAQTSLQVYLLPATINTI